MNKMVDYAPLSKVWSDAPTKPTGGTGGGKSKKKASALREKEKIRDHSSSSSPQDFENIFDKFLNERSFTNMDALYPQMAKENTYDMDFPQNAFVKRDPTQKDEPEGIVDDEIGIDSAYRFEDLLKDDKLSAYGNEAPLDLAVDKSNALKHHKNMKLYDKSRNENARCAPFEMGEEDEGSLAIDADAMEPHKPLPVREEDEDMHPYYNDTGPERESVRQDTTTHIFNLVLYLVSGIFMIFMFELVYMLSKR